LQKADSLLGSVTEKPKSKVTMQKARKQDTVDQQRKQPLSAKKKTKKWMKRKRL
jgi:hypothetical protein